MAVLSIYALPTLALVRATPSFDGRTNDPDLGDYLVLGVGLLVAVSVGIFLVLKLAGVDGDAGIIASGITDEPEQQRLVTRWLERARWARFVGGLAGFVAWLLGTQARGDLLALGSGGIVIGAVVAELHHLRRPAGPRTARLEERRVRDYLDKSYARWMFGVGLASLLVAAVGAVSAKTRSASGWGLAAFAPLCVARLMQVIVATRARPAVSESMTFADNVVRELAIGRGLAIPSVVFSLTLLSKAFVALQPTFGPWVAIPVASTALLSVGLWWRNRRLGLDGFLPARQRRTQPT